MNVHSSFMFYWQTLKAREMCDHKGMNEYVKYPHNRYLNSSNSSIKNKKEWTTSIPNNMNESQNNNAG